MLALLLSACLPVFAISQAQAQQPVAARIAAQNALFEEYYQDDLKFSPESATAYGDYRYNDQLDDDSLAAIAREHASDVAFLARLQAIPTAGFPEQDALSHQILERTLQQRIANYDFKEYEMPRQPDERPASLALRPAATPCRSTPSSTTRTTSRACTRFPRVFTQTEEVMRAGMKDNLMPVQVPAREGPGAVPGHHRRRPVPHPHKEVPRQLSPTRTSSASPKRSPTPSTPRSFPPTSPSPRSSPPTTPRTAAPLSPSLRCPTARRATRTTSAAAPPPTSRRKQIHDIGLQRDRPHRGRDAGHRQEGRLRRPCQPSAPRSRPTRSTKPHPPSRSSTTSASTSPRCSPSCRSSSPSLPKSPSPSRPSPPIQPGQATHYQTGTPDGKRPGRVSVATSDSTHRSLIDDEATAYHEGIPGHHMQLSVAQTLTGLPKFRLHTVNSGYIEGWALYAEQLGKEIGFYQDPVSDYGRLSLRALPRRPPRRRYRHPLPGLDARPGRRLLPQVRRRRRAHPPGRDRPLHRLARPGPQLQARPAQIPRAARPRPESPRPEVRHPHLPRRDAHRRRPAARPAGRPHQRLDRGAAPTNARK